MTVSHLDPDVIPPSTPSLKWSWSLAHLDRKEFVMRASRRQRGGGSAEDSSDFLETQQVTIEGERLLQIFT